MYRTRFLVAAALIAGTVACSEESPFQPTAPQLGVTGPAVATEAALQAALDAASASTSPSLIRIAAGAEIHLTSTLVYDGAAPLRVRGGGATLYGPATGSAFEATGGGDLALADLTVMGAGEHGVYVEVPASRTGVFQVVIDGVILEANGFAGLWVDDQVYDSPADVDVRVFRSRVIDNNTAGVGEGDDLPDLADKDGIRVNEGGAGDLILLVEDSWFEGNEADGLELDEIGDGDVHSTVRHSSFIDNGEQRQFPEDLEDGFDIDEADDGSIHASFVDVFVTGHRDEGIDLDELGSGGIYATMVRVSSLANSDDNISLTESEDDEGEGEGDIVIDFRHVDASERDANDDGDGIKLEEFGVGSVNGKIVQSRIANNEDDGIQVDESGPGGGFLTFIQVVFEGNLDDDINSDVDYRVLPR